MPLSTLKLNAKLLKELDLVSCENSKPLRLTAAGILVLKIIDSAQSSLKVAGRSQGKSGRFKAAVCKTVDPGSSPGSGTKR